MKRLLIAVTLAAASIAQPLLAADVGVSINIGQPGFYGRLDIGGFPPPPLLYPQPVMIQPVPMGRQPLYLRVPPGHARHWERHCHEYQACNERVYFVQDNWYNREYAPRYQERHSAYNDGSREAYRDNRREYRTDERRDYRQEERRDERGGERGRGEGRDHGGRDHERER